MAEQLVHTGYGNSDSRYPIRLYVTYSTTQDISSNTSTITCGMYVTTPTSWYNIGPWSDYNGSYVGTSSLTFDGYLPNFAGTRTLASGKSFTVSHNSDGTGSATIYWKWGVNSPWGGFVNPSGSFNITLPAIPRASSITCTTADIESNAVINISRASSNFTHTLTYAFGNLSGTIATKTSSTSISFSLPTTFYSQIPNAKSGVGTITCYTYNGSTHIGTSTCSFTATVNADKSKPTLNPTIVDSNATTKTLTGDSSKLIRYYSTASFTVGATARNSSTIKSQGCSHLGNNYSGSSGTIPNFQSGSFILSATDSRGFTTTQTINRTLIDYVKLTCSLSGGAPSTSGVVTLQVNGYYWDGNFGAESNTLTVQYRYKTQGGSYSDWTDITPTKSNDTYSGTVTISGLDYQTTYVFQARAIDKLSNITTNEQARRTTPVFDWSKDNFNINGTLTINNQSLISVIKQSVIDTVYPVGSIYIAYNHTNPSTLFGGTWKRIEEAFLWASGPNATIGVTGGEMTHTLTSAEMPAHEGHLIANYPYAEGGTTGYYMNSDKLTSYGNTSRGWYIHDGNEVHPAGFTRGSNQAHNNMPPYIQVSVWRRTA